MILNRQKAVTLDLKALQAFTRRLRKLLRLGRRDFDVCFVSNREIARLNAAFLGRRYSTDVLAFPWREHGERGTSWSPRGELRGFLGDVVISAETARRNARAVGHSTKTEVCWLILHGTLHLLGYDHERDQGEMTSSELSLRERLGITAEPKRPRKAPRRKSR